MPTISASSISHPKGSSGFLETVGKGLIVVYRNRPPAGLKHFRHLVEELVTGIEDLPLLVARILAVLANNQDRIDGQPGPAATHRPGDRRVYLEAEIPGAIPAQIVGRLLIDVHGNHLGIGLVPLARERIPHDEPVPDMLRVRLEPENGGDDSDAFRPHPRLRQRRNGSRGLEEGPAGKLWRHNHVLQ